MIPLLFFGCLFAIGGGAFALMWANIKSINEMNTPIKTTRHPEAPLPGEEVMYVDVSSMNSKQFADQKQKLEKLFEE
jgi:hypothetical protein|tara:strand:- start:1762 stop:1992 length:231 start_codon:yes stop_codon:yes gene_type:complete